MTTATSVKQHDSGIRLRAGLRTVLVYLLLLVIAGATVGPFLVMVSASLRPNFSYMTFPISLIPPDPGVDNYIRLFNQTAIGRWIFNSVFVATSVTLLQVTTCSLAGYAFSRGEFPGRDLIFWVFMGTLMVPSTVTIVPLFLILSR